MRTRYHRAAPIAGDVDDVADLVDLKQRRHGRHSVLAERTAEHVPGSGKL